MVAAARHQVTQAWWASRRDAFSLFVSKLVLEEEAEGNPEAVEWRLAVAGALPLVNVTDRAMRLARERPPIRSTPDELMGEPTERGDRER